MAADQDSSSESSPVLRGQLPGPGSPLPPGAVAAQYGGFGGFDFQEYQDNMNMAMQKFGGGGGQGRPGRPQGGRGAMQAAAATAQNMVAQQFAAAAAAGGFPGGVPFGFIGGGPGYGLSPYPQAQSPFPYSAQMPPQPPYGFGMYGGAPPSTAPRYQMMSPYATPMVSPGILEPSSQGMPPMPGMPGMAAPAAGGANQPGAIGRPGQMMSETGLCKWLPGPEYGPVLGPTEFAIVKPPKLEIHDLLKPIPEDRETAASPYLVFDLLFPPNSIHLSNERPNKSWNKGRTAPATFPRLRVMRVVCRSLPWVIQISTDEDGGLTVYHIAEALYAHFKVNASQDEDWNPLDQALKAEILATYKWNRSTEPGAPGGSLSEALLRGDFLMEKTLFAGLKPCDPELCEQKMDVKNMPATFELLLHTR